MIGLPAVDRQLNPVLTLLRDCDEKFSLLVIRDDIPVQGIPLLLDIPAVQIFSKHTAHAPAWMLLVL